MPQNRALNRGEWRKLENRIRNERATRVIAGALYNNCGNEWIEAPCYVYKIAILAMAKSSPTSPKNGEARQRPEKELPPPSSPPGL